MMSYEEPAAEAPTSKWDVIGSIVRSTAWLIAFAIACFAGLVAVWYFDVALPWRAGALILMTVCIAGPFVACYSALFAYLYNKKSMIPVLVVDGDHKELSLKYFSPEAFGDLDVEGGDLGTRRSKAGTVHIAEDYAVRQSREINPETGEEELSARRVLTASWEGACDNLEFIEEVKRWKAQKDKLIPLAKAGVESRAGADMAVLENTDKVAHGLLAGTEKDVFFETGDGVAFDWSTDVTDEDVIPEQPAADDPDREETPEPGTRDVQERFTQPEVSADD